MTGNVVQTETVFLTGLTIGTTYYIRVLNEGDGTGVAALHHKYVFLLLQIMMSQRVLQYCLWV